MPRPRGCLRGLGVLIVALVLMVAATAVWVDTSIARVAYQPAARVAGSGGTNWLLVGSDSRQGLTEDDVARLGTGGDIGVGRTDTIMVLHMGLTGKPTLLSIPRDSYVAVPGYGMDKINAAFALGGPELLVATVEQSTGLHIDHYAEVGFGGFAGMVDAVGGVTLCPDQDIDDPLANLQVAAGCQEMDGPTALGFVRTRATAEGDLDRVRRQREFFAALVEKATRAGTLLNPVKDLKLAGAVKDSFTIGDGDHVWSLARVALAAAGGVEMATMPVGGFADTEVGNVVLWDPSEASVLLQNLGVKNPPTLQG
ncbi:LytTR family transcriptional regulator [Corynebacterium sp. 13CS0277]|nr:LytTR family transcriptional regulator [Corynebacterium sp. 13CS0277]